MKSGFDINKISSDGYLIIPLSMSRLAKGQDPESTYKILDFFVDKLETYSNDVVFLYTNGLYFNTKEVSFAVRIRTNQQMISHSAALRKLIQKRKKYIPNAFHFLPFDYVILNSPYFSNFFDILKKLETRDSVFRKYLNEAVMGRTYEEANVNFLLEEIAISHILRQRLVELPRTLVRNDIWRLIVYPGCYIKADIYQWKKKVLPQIDNINPFSGAHYDFSEKKIFVFDDLSL